MRQVVDAIEAEFRTVDEKAADGSIVDRPAHFHGFFIGEFQRLADRNADWATGGKESHVLSRSYGCSNLLDTSFHSQAGLLPSGHTWNDVITSSPLQSQAFKKLPQLSAAALVSIQHKVTQFLASGVFVALHEPAKEPKCVKLVEFINNFNILRYIRHEL